MKGALAAVLLLAAACSLGAVPLPTATADIGATHVSLARGSYCWSSGGQGTCADSADPETLIRTGYLKPVTAPAGAQVQVMFNSKPSTVENTLLWAANGTVTAATSAGASFALTAQPGRYVYAITGKWQEGDVSFLLPVDVTR
jgi:hypothetical protein